MVYLLAALGIVACWLIGGQVEKGARRYGIPGILFLLAAYNVMQYDGVWWHYLPLFLTMPELALGYGQGSFAAKIFREEVAIRLCYAVLLAIPLTITAAFTGESAWSALVTILLVLAFQVRAGLWFKIGKRFEILIEDICRSVAFALGVLLVL